MDKNFFLQNPPLDFNVLAKLKFSDFFSNGTPILLETINVTHNININLVTYLRICTALGNFYNSLKRNRVTDNTSINLSTFFSSFQKGSKSVRRIFVHGKNTKSKPNNLTPVKTFFRVSNIPVLPDCVLTFWASSWNQNFMLNNVRDFIFKFNYNYLSINTRLSHFVEGQSRLCSLCLASSVANPGEENFSHLFFDCQFTNGIYDKLYVEFLSDLNLSLPDRRVFFFTGIVTNLGHNYFLENFIRCTQFLIWKAKIKRRNILYYTFKCDLFYIFSFVHRLSLCVQIDRNKLLHVKLCRDWDLLADRYG